MNPAAAAAQLAALLPGWAAVGASGPADPATLHPDEATAIDRAVPARRREFAGGRAAARQALRALTAIAPPVPMGPDRAPLWPPGIVGSIAHADGLCLAAVARAADCTGLGIDIETDGPLPAEAVAEVLLPGEDTGAGRLVFAAKEAVFKALYPRVGTVFGFDAVRIALGPDTFSARTLIPLGPCPGGRTLTGRHIRTHGLILTALALPAG